MDHGQYSSQHAGALKHWRGLFNTAIELTKPGIIVGNLASVLGGYLLAASGHVATVTHGLATLLGTALVIGCGCVINNCIDRDIDRRMVRIGHWHCAPSACPLPQAMGSSWAPAVLACCGPAAMRWRVGWQWSGW